MSARRLAPLGLLAAAALIAAGCGSSDDSAGSTDTHSAAAQADAGAATGAPGTPASGSGGSGHTKLLLRADGAGQLKFDKSDLQAAAGKVTIKLENPAPLSHNIAIDGVAKEGEVVGHDGISTLTTDLEPGTYTYYCAVPGHRQAGMQGTLTVR